MHSLVFMGRGMLLEYCWCRQFQQAISRRFIQLRQRVSNRRSTHKLLLKSTKEYKIKMTEMYQPHGVRNLAKLWKRT